MITDKPNKFSEIHVLLRQRKYDSILKLMTFANGKTLRKDYRTDPNHSYYILGDIEFKKENFERASYYFKRAIKVRSDDTEALLALGNCFDAMKLPVKARNTLQKALALKPRDKSIKFNLANAQLDLGNYEKAVPLFKSAAKSKNVQISKGAKRNCKLALTKLGKK
jgi:Flp pilus assembly protein TadD